MNAPPAIPRPEGLSPATRALVPAVMEFIAADGASDDAFDAMALRLFEHQYTHNEPLRRFCQRRGLTPRRVASWKDIPAVPINAFKELTLSCEPPEACERVFMTSGTTRAEVKGRHHHPTIAVWDLSMRRGFERHFMQGFGAPRVFADGFAGAVPRPQQAEHFALGIDDFFFIGRQRFAGLKDHAIQSHHAFAALSAKNINQSATNLLVDLKAK